MGKTSTGNCSTGNRSTGDWSTGDWSTGNCSTGYRSTGDWSTGDWSTGNCSTGNRSTGYRSTGDWSTGNRSTGNCSTGNRSTGDWSISSYSTGHFSTVDYSGFGSFNKECTKKEWDSATIPTFLCLDLTEWISSNNMTDQEKNNNQSHQFTGGYLKEYTYKEAWANAWKKATDEDKELLYKLPNFDKDVFKEISGIDIDKDNAKELTVAEIEKQLGYKIKIIKGE